jgi:hypothetical protein
MSLVWFENDDLKLVESENHYFLVADNFRVVYDGECNIDRVCVKKMSEQPKYYDKNGLSPLDAFKQGLISRDEYCGFIKGNIIKYVVRCEDKDDPIDDIDKAMNYLYELYYLIGSEKLNMSIEEFKTLSDLVKARECLDNEIE